MTFYLKSVIDATMIFTANQPLYEISLVSDTIWLGIECREKRPYPYQKYGPNLGERKIQWLLPLNILNILNLKI